MATVSDVITIARHQLRDVTAGAYKWTDAELIKYADEGQRDIFRRHPESIIGTTVTATFSVSALTLTSSTLEVADQYVHDLADYVTARAAEIATDYASIQQANYYRNRYLQQVNT